MTLRNEIFEGLGAAKASMDLVKGVRGDPRDDYYREIARAAKRRNEQEDFYDKQNRDPITGGYKIPPIAGTNTPGTPTTGTPIPGMSGASSDPLLNPPVRPMPVGRRGGLIPRYQYGGSVQHFEYGGTPEDDQSEADLVLRSILARDHEEMARKGRGLRSMSGASDTVNRALLPEPPPHDAQQLEADLQRDAAPRRREITGRVNQQLEQSPSGRYPTSPPSELEIPTSAAGSWYERNVMRPVLGSDRRDPRTQQGFDEKWLSDIDAKIAQARVGGMESVTGEERERRNALVAELEREKALGRPSERISQRAKAFDDANPRPGAPDRTQEPAPPPVPAPQPKPAAGAAQAAQPAAQAPAPPPAPAPAAPPTALRPNADMLNKMIQPGPYDTDMLPFDRAPAPEPKPPAPPPNARGGNANGPPTTGNSGPSGTSAPPAPPAGATDPNAANRALPREQRTTAFDPRFETGAGYVDASGRDIRAMDTGAPPPAGGGGGREQAVGTPSSGMTGGQADQGLSSNSVADVSKVVSGALSYGRSSGGDGSFVGHKAISKEAFDQLIAQNNQGGRLSEGNAWLNGMVRSYQVALMFGWTDRANAMAYGIIQQANMIASSYGHAAVDALRRGDLATAAKYTEGGLDHIPDSMNHSVSADGRNWVTTDPRTGKVTGQIPIDGRWVLKAALGLQNGSLMWQTLHASAAQLNKDKDPVGRQLRHQLTIKQMEMLDERMRRSKAGGTKGGVSSLAADTLDLVGAGPSSQHSSRNDQQSQADRDEATDLALAFSNPGGYDEREQ